MTTSSKQHDTADHVLLGELTVKTPQGTRRLTRAECEDAIQLFAVKANAQTFDIRNLIPRGSILDLIARHFEETDISHALPIMQIVMIAASYLTQNGATLRIPGVGEICPTLWLVGLAGSGSSKTFASEEIDRIISRGTIDTVTRLATGCTDAQWIVELHENNGAFWFQDEVGKTFNKILTQGSYVRIKEWVLNAYSYNAIANRLKSEKNKLVIENPHFTFHGLSVDETWHDDIDLTSMLDGFCQRFSYYIANPRQDTDMFDHFLYFEGEEVEERRHRLADTWDALCTQKEACGQYTLNDDVLPYLKAWWSSLRESWGKTALPKSFIRRIGFSVLRYLMVLHFLLGKSRRPIDLETAELATRFAEYHFLSALHVVQQYDRKNTSRIQIIAAAVRRLSDAGKPVTGREISRMLSKKQRDQFVRGEIAEILQIIQKIEETPGLFEDPSNESQNRFEMQGTREKIQARLLLNERKRNERRLRELRRGAAQDPSRSGDHGSLQDQDDNVVQIILPMTGTS